MRIARVAGVGFAFAVPERDGWVSGAGIGMRTDDFAQLVTDLQKISARVATTTPDIHDVRLVAPLRRPGKVLAVGLNYRQHIAELNKPSPDVPMIFAKYSTAVTGPFDPIELNPSVTAEVDYEAELAVMIGLPARNVDATDALDHVLGYCVANDVSARDLQRQEIQISRSKSLDTFCPLGPWITTADEIEHPQALRITTTVNGVIRQDSTTADLLFGISELVAHLSSTTTLEPGDVILTGTPSGVGSAMTPPTYLREGDIVCCEIENLGHIEIHVVMPAAVG
jgi:2-keto-4-pentenoate hydratase/2-oxohepta-3-ene-1,7-dioic acid hydratase in catechol pathway